MREDESSVVICDCGDTADDTSCLRVARSENHLYSEEMKVEVYPSLRSEWKPRTTDQKRKTVVSPCLFSSIYRRVYSSASVYSVQTDLQPHACSPLHVWIDSCCASSSQLSIHTNVGQASRPLETNRMWSKRKRRFDWRDLLLKQRSVVSGMLFQQLSLCGKMQ